VIINNLFLIFLLTTFNNNVVRGKVYDSYSKEPLPFANILVEGTGMGTVTDTDGYYYLEVPDTLNECYLIYKMIGYRQDRKKIVFGINNKVEVNVAMRMEPLKMQGIMVSAKKERFKESASITPTSISHKELRMSPSLIEGDLMRSIAMLPGVTKATDFSTSISVRGGGPDQNEVLIDDVPILNPSHLFGLVSAFNVNAISDVELYSSGIPIRHDNSLSSVLDIKTRGVGREIKGLTGVFSVSPLSAGITIGRPFSGINSNVLFTFRRTYADQLLKLFDFNLPYYFYDSYFHAEMDIKGWTFILSGYLGKDFLDIRDEDNDDLSIVGFDWGNKVGTLNAFHSCGEDIFHIAVGWSNHNFGFSLLDTLFITHGDLHVGNISLDYSKKIKEHDITIGIVENYRPFTYDANILMGYRYEYEGIWSNRAFFYIQDTFRPAEKILMSGGLGFTHYYSEAEKFNAYNLDYLTAYRLAIKYFLADLYGATFSFGNFHQFVVPAGGIMGQEDNNTFPIYYWVPMGGEYAPEEAQHFNLGLEGWLTEDYYFSLEGYYRNYSHLLQMRSDLSEIDISSDETYYRTMFESGYGKSYGFDLLLKKEIGTLRGWLSYSFLKSDVTYADKTYPSIWDRTHNLHLTVLSSLPWRWEGGTQITFSTGNPFTSDLARFRYRSGVQPYPEDDPQWIELEGEKNGVRYPPYLRIDVTATKQFYFGNNELDLKLSIFNVLNRRNVFLYYYDYDEEPPVKKPFHMLPIVPSIEIIYRF
jgi:hypothetical protein